MITRRNLLSALPFAAAVPGYAFGVEPYWLETVIQPVTIPGLKGKIRVLHLSDFHASREVPFSTIAKAVALGIAAKPDLICLTGDFITRAERTDFAAYSALLRPLKKLAPTFASLGNHDGGWAGNSDSYEDSSLVRAMLADADIPLLQNSSWVLQLGGTEIRLAGVADLWSGHVDPEAAMPAASRELPTILMAHNPDTKDVVASSRWDLMLSGHTHGGQVLVPLIGDSYIPVRDHRYIAGLKPWGTRQIYITRGVGSLAGVRFMCRPEVTVLDLAG